MDHITPTLASVFCDYCESDDLALWSKLNVNHPYSQLHSKYWGETIENEAEKWLNAHPIVYNPTNDIGPGCFVLDFGIEHYHPSKLWVRQDYIRMYNYCQDYAPAVKAPRPCSVVITGQPGIGKTLWTSYAVRRHLGEQKPFLWYCDANCYLFIEEGVYQRPVMDVRGSDFMPFLWAFIDADECTFGIPETLGGHSTNLYVIFTTSPKRQQWKCLEKCTDTMEIVMNPWSLEEMHQGAKICLTNEQQSLVEDAFKRYGPIPRICINYVQDQKKLLSYERHIQAAVSQITADNLRHIILDAGILNAGDLNAESHMIFLVRRCEVNDLIGVNVEPVSAYVEMLLMMAIDTMQRLDRITLYHTFTRIPSARVVASLLYKSLGHASQKCGPDM